MNRRVRATLALLLGLGLALGTWPPPSAEATMLFPRSSPRWQECERTLDGVRTTLGRTQRSVVVVRQTSRTYARVSSWVRRDGACVLTRKLLTRTARIGNNGTVDGRQRRQGSGTTPRGTYTITETFGNGPAPTTSMPYHRTRPGDYWVGDNGSRYYNQRRNAAQGGFRRSESENLRAFGAQYRYVAVVNFNRAPDRQRAYRGFAIFLHVKNDRGTAGCIGVTKKQMELVLRSLRPGDRIVISR